MCPRARNPILNDFWEERVLEHVRKRAVAKIVAESSYFYELYLKWGRVCELCGLCVGCMWVVCGLCVGCVWVVCGLCVGCVCVVCVLCVGCVWVVYL